MLNKKIFLCLMVLFMGLAANAQKLSKKQITDVVKETIKLIDENYIIPDVKVKLLKMLNENLNSEKYLLYNTKEKLVKEVTKDLVGTSNDHHLYLRVKKENSVMDNMQPKRRMKRMPGTEGAKSNLTFENLPGNIAVITIPLFYPLSTSQLWFDDVLKKASDADAIVFDVRKCRGGAAGAMSYVAGSFIENPTHLTTYYSKDGEMRLDSKKTPYGSKNKDKDIYILTTVGSGSACEAFAFYTQQIGRTKVYGQTSRGAGRSNSMYDISNGLYLSVSVRTSITPNGKQFEGVGVTPDKVTEGSYAKTQAHIDALKSLKKKNPKKKKYYNKILKEIKIL